MRILAILLLMNVITFNPRLIALPYPTAPACVSHDPTTYHTLWDSARGCHYNHEHGTMDFAQAAIFFGVDLRAFTGAEISYPWQTTGHTGCAENDCKHAGYKWTFKQANEDPCIAAENGPNGTDGFAVEFHARGDGHEFTTRIHSSFIAVVICNTSGARGVIVTGGWQDYGQRTSPYQGLVVNLPDQPAPPYNPGHAPYIALGCYNDNGAQADCGSKAISSSATWVSRPQSLAGGHALAQLLFRVRDAAQWVNGSTRLTMPTYRYVCGNTAYNPVGCKANNTTGAVHQVFGKVPDAWDTLDGLADGRVSYAGFTDRWGNVVSGCLSPSLDCVPLYLQGVPVGGFSTTFDDALLAFSAAALPERDICFGTFSKGGSSTVVNCDLGGVPSGWIGADN